MRLHAPLLLGLLALLLVPSAPSATSESGSPYTLSVQALRGATATDVYLSVSTDGAAVPEMLRKVQLKTFSPDGVHARTENVFDVRLNDGRAVLTRDELERHGQVEVKALLKSGSDYVLRSAARIGLRPDLTVAELTAPDRVVRGHPFDVTASIAEVAGDTSANATVSLYDGTTFLTSQPLQVLGGGHATAAFSGLRIVHPGAHTLRVEVSNTDPAEAYTANNADQSPLTVRVYDGDGVVVTEESHATDVGVDVLRAGGNAIDAAAAIQFALNVTLPHTTGIGGGSTILVHLANGGTFAIDAREKAPAAATPTMFTGKPVGDANRSGCAVGVPGTLRAVQVMLDRWGTRSLGDTLAPATALAEDGFPVGVALASATTEERARTQPETRAVFRRPDGSPLQPGDWLRQPDLARTFRLLAHDGPAALYTGEIAPALIAAQARTVASACQGRMTANDLASYDIVIRKPLFTSYHGYDVVSAPPSSSGGLVVLQALKLLRRFPLGTGTFGPDSCGAVHLEIEAERLALADRLFWMGDDDPTFGFDVPTTGLLSDAYTALRSELIHEGSRIPVAVAGNPEPFRDGGGPIEFDPPEGMHTTHFSVVDKWGNMVSFTTTLTDGFGTGIMVPGYGFVLNDGLINFNPTPLRNPATGNPGANDAAPNRRPMGNTAPVLLFKDGEPLVATGSPGGIFIPSVVLQVVSNLVDQGRSIQDAVAAPRFWLNAPQGGIAWNAGFPPSTIACLRALGHPLNPLAAPSPRAIGAAESLAVDPTTYALTAANDPRAPDGKAVVLP